ncbi:MAG: preprotein translocase subunit SecA [Planctomycetes bacterium]|nr:preprotein translocase subunit SecA [Planctomycetota bacterium]
MNRLGPRWWNYLRGALGPPTQRRRGMWGLVAEKVNALEGKIKQLSNAELTQLSRDLRRQAGEGISLNRLLPEAFALVREAAVRTIGQRHYDVQILGGIALHRGCIAEMETGEGKTLVATLPAYLNALSGRGVHVVTVNDYLANRDAEWNAPIYRLLGLTVGVVPNRHNDEEKRHAYRCDITYCTSKELGFDFLRDRLKIAAAPESKWGTVVGVGQSRAQIVQREHHYAIVDEADSILIDEARTPMIISAASTKADEELIERYRWANDLAMQLRDEEDYKFDPVKRKVELTQDGCRHVRAFPQSLPVQKQAMEDIYKNVERAVLAHRGYLRDRDYVINNEGKVIIVDEFTGRLMPGREWQDGIHRAVEAKEGVKITVETGESARVTVQAYFKKYERIAGMTGTASSEATEFRKIYKMPVLYIPTNRPLCRKVLPDVIFRTAEEKWQAVADEIARLHKTGQPLLIGTRSIEKSEHLSELLTARGVPHQVLNAKEHEKEAAIVALAGQRGTVTVATNMAGRGTDIKLGESVAELGGLCVIVTERHTARRIDRQLIGRCARQGDPGVAEIFLSLEDEVLEMITKGEKLEEKLEEAVLTRRLERLRAWAARMAHTALQTSSMRSFFTNAQVRLENQHYRQRRQLMEYEKVWDKMKKEMGIDPVLDWKQL